MIYRAIQLIQIFLADERTNGGNPRGPRGPKKYVNVLPKGWCERVNQQTSKYISKQHGRIFERCWNFAGVEGLGGGVGNPNHWKPHKRYLTTPLPNFSVSHTTNTFIFSSVPSDPESPTKLWLLICTWVVLVTFLTFSTFSIFFGVILHFEFEGHLTGATKGWFDDALSFNRSCTFDYLVKLFHFLISPLFLLVFVLFRFFPQMLEISLCVPSVALWMAFFKTTLRKFHKFTQTLKTLFLSQTNNFSSRRRNKTKWGILQAAI